MPDSRISRLDKGDAQSSRNLLSEVGSRNFAVDSDAIYSRRSITLRASTATGRRFAFAVRERYAFVAPSIAELSQGLTFCDKDLPRHVNSVRRLRKED